MRPEVRRFTIATVAAFLAGAAYPIAILASQPFRHAATFLANCPNFSVYSVVILPFAVGLLATTLSMARIRGIAWYWWVLLVAFVLFEPAIVYRAATTESTPLLPDQVQRPLGGSEESFAAFLDEVQQIRESVFKPPAEGGRTSEQAVEEYVTVAARYYGVAPDEMRGFKSIADMRRRGSLEHWIATAHSVLAGLFKVLMFWYLAYSLASREHVEKSDRERLALCLILGFSWFPFRFYAMWYQSFYSLKSFGAAPPVVFFMCLCATIILVSIFRPGRLVLSLSAIQTVLALIFGLIARFKAAYIGVAGRLVAELGIEGFVAIESTLCITLAVIVSRYVRVRQLSPAEERRPRRPKAILKR